ncbi:MAG: BamA/TamA family outer membrane protein [Myxococcales bacterium]
MRRELRLYEGELFSGSSLESSRQRVAALGLFETVDVSQRPGSADNQIVVTVHVKERPTGTFQVDLGFSSIESYLLTAQVSADNFFGWGQTASLAAQIGPLRSAMQLSFADPHLLDTDWIVSLDYLRQDLDYYGFIRRSNGGDLSIGYHLTQELMLHLGYALEQVDVEPGRSSSLGGSDVLLGNRFQSGLTSALRLTVNWDQRDNRLLPTAGNYQSVSLQYSPEWLGASFQFLRLDANTRWYVPLFWGIVFKAQGSLGYIYSLKGQLSLNELFHNPPGSNTLRGYSLRSGPSVLVGAGRSPDQPAVLVPVGGNKQLLFNFDLDFPIAETAGLRGVVFYDAGNIWGASENFFGFRPSVGPLNLLHSVGFGLRWFSPIGPLRFEGAIPLTRRPGDAPFLFELSIGHSF